MLEQDQGACCSSVQFVLRDYGVSSIQRRDFLVDLSSISLLSVSSCLREFLLVHWWSFHIPPDFYVSTEPGPKVNFHIFNLLYEEGCPVL